MNGSEQTHESDADLSTDRRNLLRAVGGVALAGAAMTAATAAAQPGAPVTSAGDAGGVHTPPVPAEPGAGAAVVDFADGRLQTGLDVMEQMGWGTNAGVKALHEDLWKITTEINFGTIWSRPGLSLRDREIICLTTLITIGARGMAMHFKNAHALGITETEIEELIIQTIPYAGFPKALSAMALYREVQRTGKTSL